MICRKTIIIFLTLLLGIIIPVTASEIHKAAKDGDFETVKKLLEKDTTLVDSGNRLQQTPLIIASYGGYKNIIQFLIDKGANVNHTDVFGATCLHMAVLGGHKEIVEFLISKGADVNIKSKNGKIPLQMAFEKDDTGIIDIFLKQGVPLDKSVNEYGRTLLHEASIMGKINAVAFLLEKGASIDIKDNLGKSALDLALICDHKNVAELLLKKGATHAEIPPLEVVYIANAGFYISSGPYKILIDAMFRTGFGKYPVPDKEVLETMLKGEPPFDNVNLLLYTFKQEAHFDPHLAEAYLLKNPKSVLLAPQEVGQELELSTTQFDKIKQQVLTITPPIKSIAQVTLQGLKLKILRLNYTPEYQNLGYIIKLESKTICYLGDAILKNNEEMLKKLQLKNEDIDVLFITYWDFLNAEARTIIDTYIQPKQIAIMHIPTEEADKITKEIRALEKNYPNVTIFRKNMANRVY